MRCLSFIVCVLLLVGSTPVRGDETPTELIDAGRKLLGTEREKEGVKLLEKAVSLLGEQIKREPKRDDLRFELGQAHFYLEHDEAAIAAFNEAIKLNADNASAHFFKGVILRQQKKLDEALPELEKAKTLDPKDADCWYEWGDALLGKGDKPQAKAALEEAVRLDPKHASALYSMAVLDAEDGRIEAGLEKCLKVIELEPSCTNAHYNAGQACQTLGRHAESLKHFRAAAKLDPNDARTAAKVVQCYQALNRPKQRDRARERVLKLHQEGKCEQAFYCRDQFSVGELRVLAFEYFKLEGERAVRYSFQVGSGDSKSPLYRISLGSYESTNAFAHDRGTVAAGERLFHLDRYYPSDAHETFAFFKGEPTYDKAREMVESILKGEVKPTSSTTPTSQGSTITIDPGKE